MNGTYISEKFAQKAVKILKPNDANQNWIDAFRKAVYNETQTVDEVLYFRQLIQKYSKKSPVLLACTELSVFSPKDNPACIDMAELQIKAFLK
jgi:aspartate racemase